jgi:hypothetical protein
MDTGLYSLSVYYVSEEETPWSETVRALSRARLGGIGRNPSSETWEGFPTGADSLSGRDPCVQWMVMTDNNNTRRVVRRKASEIRPSVRANKAFTDGPAWRPEPRYRTPEQEERDRIARQRQLPPGDRI